LDGEVKELRDKEEDDQIPSPTNTNYTKICHVKTKKEKIIVRNYKKVEKSFI